MAASDQRDEVIIKLKARIRELEAENAALKEYKVRDGKVIGNNLTRIAELKDKVAQLCEVLGAVKAKITPARNYLTSSAHFRPKEKRARAEKELGDNLDKMLALITAALVPRGE